MKKVGIVSFPRYHNYGTYLQLFALQSMVEGMGCQAEIIDYDPYNDSGNKAASESSLGVAPNPIKRALNHCLRPALRGVLSVLKKLRQGETVYTVSANDAFDQFMRDKLQMGPVTYFSPQDLSAQVPACDAFISGSDQVWHPLAHFEDSAYYLSFAPPAQRIAYAPSFGVSEIPAHCQAWMAEQIAAIPHLSVREQNGVDMVRELTGRDAHWVLDPTFLLSQELWREFAKAPQGVSGNYLFCYFLESDDYMRERAIELAEAHDLTLYLLPVHANDRALKHPRLHLLDGLGPQEFVSMISNARLVCTDSFHGTAFSIMLQSAFFTLQRYDNPKQVAAHSRIHSILNLTAFQSRLLGRDEGLPESVFEIDFGHAQNALEARRVESKRYLSNALQQALSAGTDLADESISSSTVSHQCNELSSATAAA